MANTKYIATLRLDLSKLNKDTEEVNKLLKSIGAGVNLDMSDVVEKQVKQMLTLLKNEVQKAASTGGQAGKKMAEGLSEAKTEIERVVSVTTKLAKNGSLTETVKGYKDLGTTISEVRKEGELLSRTTTVKGELSKEIEKANTLYKEQVGYLKEMYSLRTQRLAATDGSEQAKKLDAEIQKYGALIAKSREQIASLSDEAKQLSNINKLGEERAKIIKQYQAALKADGKTEAIHGLADALRGSEQAKKLDAEIQKYGTLIAKSREQIASLSDEAKQLSNINKLGEERAKIIKQYQAALKADGKTEAIHGSANALHGSEQAKKLDAEIQKYGVLIAKSREQIASLSDEAKQLSNINKLGEERAKIIKQYQAALKADGKTETIHGSADALHGSKNKRSALVSQSVFGYNPSRVLTTKFALRIRGTLWKKGNGSGFSLCPRRPWARTVGV